MVTAPGLGLRRAGYLHWVNTVSVDRERDSSELPEAMRGDVRLLGETLGEIISEDDPTLLPDVERLRHAVIAARQAAGRPSGAGSIVDEIVGLVGSWSHSRAEQVARAFTVYFHLVNLAEEQQRVRTLRERDSGDLPPRESLAEAVARITTEQGAEQVTTQLDGLRAP